MTDSKTLHGLRTITKQCLEDLKLNSIEEGQVIYVYGFISSANKFFSRKGIMSPEVDPEYDDFSIGLFDEDVSNLISDIITVGFMPGKLYHFPYAVNHVIWFEEENEFLAKNKIYKYFQSQITEREQEIWNYKNYIKRLIDSDHPTSIQDIIDTMTDEQTQALYYLVGKAQQGSL